jgi:hypothetical protein
MSDPKNPAPEKKTFEQFIATVPEAPSSSKEPAAEAADPKAETPAPAPSVDATKTDVSGAAPAGPTTDVAAIVAALKTGDLDTLAEAIGEDPALYSEKSTKWAAARRKETKLKAERDSVTAKAEGIVKRWAPVAEDAAAVQQGQFVRFVALAEALTGMDYDQLVMKVARARHGSDPQVEVLRKRVAELEPVAAERAAAQTTASERAFLETIRDEVAADHPVRQLGEGWQASVAAVLRESMDEDLGEPSISTKQAADRVLRREREAYEARAKVFGGGAAPARRAPAKTPERAEGATGAGKRKLTRDEWLAAQK